MQILTFSVLFILCYADVCRGKATDGEEFVDPQTGARWRSTNTEQRLVWKRGPDFVGALRETPEQRKRRPTITHAPISVANLPENFNAKDKWPECDSITEIRDQSSCGSCWAFGAVEAMTDRLCIHSNGKVKKRVGATDLLSCCKGCGYGCHGGFPATAWDFWVNTGITTGGSKENPTGCRSYPFPKCDHHGEGSYGPCPHKIFDTPNCTHTCDKQEGSYNLEKTRGKTAYNVDYDESQIMQEIMLNGPVEVAFTVYEDFMKYKSGIYFHSWGNELGGHAIRMLGWGVDQNGIKYWLLANSWNEEWGEDGYFRILRGRDECGIESEVTAGLPKLEPFGL